MERNIQLSVFVLICINTMSGILHSIKGPTLIFYLNELGGGTEELGIMTAVESLAMFIMLPLYGMWVDSNGNKYRPPYMTTFLVGIVANTIYFLAVLLPKGPIALYTVIFSRFLGGAAESGKSLAYSWLASTVQHDQQTFIITLLTSAGTLGGAIGPITNTLVSKIHTEFRILGHTIPVDPYNSIGLLLVVGEIILMVLMLLFFQEPPERKVHKKVTFEESGVKTESKGIMYALSHFDILFPILIRIAMFSIFGLGIAFTPVARDLGWTPVQVSEVSAVGSVIMAGTMAITVFASMANFSDTAMISFGMGNLFLASSFMYTLWTEGMGHGFWQLSAPQWIMFFGYPFIGPSVRSRYIKAIHNKSELEGSTGLMMSLMSQADAITSFIVPLLLVAFVIRDPADVAAGPDKHLLTRGALYPPAFASLVIAKLLYEHFFIDLPSQKQSNDDSAAVSENTKLLSRAGNKKPRSSLIAVRDSLSRSSETYKRISVEVMGIPNPVETKFEKELNEQLLKDKEIWDEIESFEEIEK